MSSHVRSQVLRINPANRSIIQGFAFGAVFLVLAKVCGAAKEVVLAHAYGTASELDAYSLGFSIASWPVALSGMCANALLIPMFVDAIRSEEATKWVDVATLLRRVVPISCGIAGVVYIVLRFTAPTLLSSRDAALAMSSQAAGLSLMVPVGVVASVFAAKLIASGRQISALLEGIPSVFVAVCVLAIGSAVPPAPLLAWSTCLGMFFYVGALLAAGRHPLAGPVRGERIGISLGRGFLLVLLAQVVFTLGGATFDQIVVGDIQSQQNAALAYANRLLMLLTGLGATAIARAIMPVLSEAWSTHPGQARDILRQWFCSLLGGGVAVALISYALAPIGVSLLFEHGNFSSDDARMVTELVRAGLFQLPFYFASLILAQWTVIQRRFGVLLIANVLSVASKILLVAAFRSVVDASILMYGSAVMYLVSTLVLGAMHFKKKSRA